MIETTVIVCDRNYGGVLMESFLDRLLGIHRAPLDAEVVVIPGSSVHGLTLVRPVTCVAISIEATRRHSHVVRPGRVVRILGATAIAEFPQELVCQADHDMHHVRWLR